MMVEKDELLNPPTFFQHMKFSVLFLVAFSVHFSAQTFDYKRAPNSYIFDTGLAESQNFQGLYIPVRKAYEMWSSYPYLKADTGYTPIPSGTMTATLVWEDHPGQITEIDLEQASQPKDSRIKVRVNPALGNGNAVVALKVNNVTYWSWHIWITDNPENGVDYTQGFETDINNKAIRVKYMDRNLGASSAHFLGHNWHKSGGLMYEWGRKDPFPALVYKDLEFYELNSEKGRLYHPELSKGKIPVVLRPYDDIESNIRYSVKNPLNYIINSDANNWFSNKRHKVAGSGTTFTAWDLWADNYKGGNGNANSSNATVKKDSRSYELKSELDPCPNGWRVPSYYGRVTVNNNLSPWGRKGSGYNDDTIPENNLLYPNSANPVLNGLKVYPGLGMDFTDAQAGQRNLGIMPISGNYEYYPNVVAPNAPVGIMYQDENADGGLWSATFAFDGARPLGLVADPGGTKTSVGWHGIYINQTNPSKIGNAVRCMKDPNLPSIGDFETEYFQYSKENYKTGLDQPNSYLVVEDNHLSIPVNKPFAVYNQLLSDHEMLPYSQLVAKIFWTDNQNLVSHIEFISAEDARNGLIEIDLAEGQKGNAVVSLHNESVTSPAYWSWHIWVPESDPTVNTVTYLTEPPLETAYNFVNATPSLAPPLITEIMDRNLGALQGLESAAAPLSKINGLLYQWGRKDPVPQFTRSVFVGGSPSEDGSTPYQQINTQHYENYFSKYYAEYGSEATNAYQKILENIAYSIGNPFTFLYHEGTGALYDGGDKTLNNLNEIRDWVSDERSMAGNRWGHGEGKSPYDPCPSGWRVPDVSFSALYINSKASSPFYNSYRNDWAGKKGVIQDQWHNIPKYYGGTAITNGWEFANEDFPLGTFSKDGIRGELGENKFTNSRSGVWLAAMGDMATGYVLGMQFYGNNLATGTGVYPQAAMSVRCAKDEPRYLGAPVKQRNKAGKILEKLVIEEVSVAEPTYFYPNPVQEVLFVSKEIKSFEVYDFSGKLVKNGTLQGKEISLSDLPKGIYVIKVTQADGKVRSSKIVKK